MPLDLRKLDIVREKAGRFYGRCPACAELGEDRKKQHLVIFESGIPYCCKYGDDEEHKNRIWQLAGMNRKGGGVPAIPQPLPANHRPDPAALPDMPPLWRLRWITARRICLTRGWSLDAVPGLFELADRGMLCTAELWDNEGWHDAWVIKDSSRRSLQAKKLYGKNWACGKVKNLPGSWGRWTIGASNISDRPIVVLCEGMPDFVAALCVAHFEGVPLTAVAPVCIAGTGNRIHFEALPHFAGKRVRIFAHPDEAGQKAANVWAAQLLSVGAKVSLARIAGLNRKHGVPVKDLADYLTLLDGQTEPPGYVLRDLWREEITAQIDRWSP